MNRTDSAFHETIRVEPCDERPKTTSRRCKKTSGRRQRSKHTPADTQSNDQISTLSTIRPTSEQSPTSPRRSTEPRRKSITTASSSNSAKSRRRGHGSAPSSRRTSCTVIDPSRPTRHYRINSSQTCPTLNRDIDDVIALHFRSCSLFQNPTHRPSLASPTMSACGPSAAAEIGATPGSRPRLQASSFGGTPQFAPSALDEKAGVDADVDEEAPTMHWMSPSTRKTQYEKIDRANAGFRGLLRRFTPRCVSGPGPARFYEAERSDAGSVRRYRMDLTCEGDGDARSISDLKLQRQKLERSTHGGQARKKIFGCF